ncbi:hypothetical protein CALVIDRAFT_58866 [Calocera viscosa TUFC12733]|uniref:Glycopeptide n=1 Tax=Calocera viscosa (strain TUFC12733) TaxID=1330018 RepID=A0A167NHW0_CALVF|nr:hypothetical protein CALVIDRAFT_58866 [Calocera viscosa TUFC12733]
MNGITALLSFSMLAAVVIAESHTIEFTNNCGFGTPTLVVDGTVVSTGDAYTANGPITDAFAFLQSGSCGANGESCAVLEPYLCNAADSGCNGSYVDLEITPPYSLSPEFRWYFYGNDCAGEGVTCNDDQCAIVFCD